MKKWNACSDTAEARASGEISVTRVCIELCSMKKPRPSNIPEAIKSHADAAMAIAHMPAPAQTPPSRIIPRAPTRATKRGASAV